MAKQDHIKEFESFAGNLIIQYSSYLPSDTVNNKRKLLRSLDKAISKMDNELTGKLTHIMALAEELSDINEDILEQDLEAIKRSTILELIKRNF